MEEFARFVLDDAGLSGELKSIRHSLTEAIGIVRRVDLLASRDTPGDVGTTIEVDSESRRTVAGDVIAAAASRTAQSLRVIEEYGKTLSTLMASRVEQLRYRTYTAAAALELAAITDDRRTRLETSALYVLVDGADDAETFAQTVLSLSVAGVDVIQLRDHRHDDRTLIERARAGTQIAGEHGVLFIVNDRADLALASGADGVHVGQEELPVEVARQILGPTGLIGLSTHSIEQARGAVAVGADYIGCGPVFAGRTKQFDDYVGTRFLAKVAAEIDLPAFAIGGIDLQNVGAVVDAGARRIAVTGVVRDADDPAAVVAELKAKLAAGEVAGRAGAGDLG